ncbi:MAG: Polyribonucleotide nucleotidyltransferase [Bacteroidetes bacterium ADurb.Bin408]|nr:MAG: Polyribonucleotide nucleotidyltransferase [Bacteroidetes bacterium ADurb.Bin408]
MTENIVTKDITLADGRTITIETGRLAKQANGAVVVKMGDTMLLATAVTRKEAAENVDFLPLTVEYQEKYAAAGRFPGGFFKREARPSEYEILVSRYVDRALRPLFPEDYHAETQVIITLISAEKDIMPDALACLAASAALSVSDIPFNGPVSEVRVCRVNGRFIINPTMSEIAEADIEMVVAGSVDNIVMVEGEMKEVQESDMIEAIKAAHEAIKLQCAAQSELMQMVEKAQQKIQYCHEVNDPELENKINDMCFGKLYQMAMSGIANKHVRKETIDAIKQEFIATLTPEEAKEKDVLISRYFHNTEKKAVRKAILNEKIRLDGRKTEDIRPIWCMANYLPSAHGSAIFTRGETQSLTTVTLGTKLDEQILDGAVIEGKSKFILHYNFPPFCTGEVKMQRGTSRREIGHGNLALRALKPVLPKEEDNPYTIRVVSDILESNGSSSMATVCAGTIALMDAGVKISKPVSGIAMGLISDSETKQYAVLSDILGDEDHLGDMDFKVTGTRDGITACQMDIKIDGLSYEILTNALNQAKNGRLYILGKIEETIKEPRADYKPFVPRIVKMSVPKEFIGAIIGPGGKIIQEMQREFSCTITIEEVGEVGIVDIFSENKESIDGVIARIKGIIAVPEIGENYKGKVKSVMPFGLFVEILPGKDGLLHISEIDWKRFEKTEDAGFQAGDIIEVKLIDIDKKTGKLKLSRKVLIPRPPKND